MRQRPHLEARCVDETVTGSTADEGYRLTRNLSQIDSSNPASRVSMMVVIFTVVGLVSESTKGGPEIGAALACGEWWWVFGFC